MAARDDAKEHERLLPAPSRDAAPLAVGLTVNDDYGEAVDALAMARFLDGRQPRARMTRLHRLKHDALLLPEGAEPSWVVKGDHRTVSLVHGEGWTLYAVRWTDHTADVTVTATSDELVERIMAQVTDGVVEPPPPEDETVSMGFWYLGPRGPCRQPRQISVDEWPTIRRNYGKRVGVALGRLMAVEPATLSGRLLMLHGPPGTGKTSALRALARAWGKWCEVDYVVDPERMLDAPGYLMSVATGQDAEDPDKWRLVLLEDCDELIRAEAKPSSGQSLSRLLNLTDGLLGQGLKLLVAITTNEPLAKLHPAVVRPGRCIAQIEVGRLSPAEARAWLGRPATIDPEGATLAELYALRGELTTVEELAPAAGGGLYL